jgi:hypothetical protein
MKHLRLMLSLTVMCLLLLATACGAGEPTIETPVEEMNVTAADLGPNWSLQQEQGKGELADILDAGDLADANMRVFAAAAEQTTFVSQIISVNSVASAKATMAADFVDAFTTGIQSSLPGLALDETEAPNVGDEALMLGGNMSDLGFNVYVLAFRKANVIATLFLMGPAESVTQENAVDYAQKLEAKIH